MRKPGLFLYFIPLLACTLGILAGRWISAQASIHSLVEALAGKWVNLVLGADNPSLVLGALGLLLGAAVVRGLSRGKAGQDEDREDTGRDRE